MKVQELCHRPVVTIGESASLAEAARRMREQHVGALVVTGGEGAAQVVGVVTDRDLVVEAMARDLPAGDTPVGRIASRPLAIVQGEADLGEAATTMREAGVRRLLVVRVSDKQLLGLVSSDDLMEAMTRELGALAEALRADVVRETASRHELPPTAARPVFLSAGTPGMRWPGPVGG